MEKKGKIDSAEIARIAGVSRATVSRVINNKGVVKPETVEKVMQVIQRFSYTPNLQAQVLAGKRSNTIGLFFTANARQADRSEDSHMDFIVSMVIDAASASDFYVLVKTVSDPANALLQSRIRDMFSQNRIDAGIFIGFPNHYALIEELIASGYVLGIFDQYISGRNEPNRIIVNIDGKAMTDSVDYLASLGHTRIMCLHGDPARFSGQEKHDAFQRSLARRGLYSPPEWQLFTRFSGWSAAEQMEQFLKKTKEIPTALCCANDTIAFGALDVLKKHGIRVPDDISVTGADDIRLSRFYTPALTTNRVDFNSLLNTLTSKVIEYLDTPFKRQFRAVFSSELVVRASCMQRTM